VSADLGERLRAWGETLPRFEGDPRRDAAALGAWHRSSSPLMAALATGGPEAAPARKAWRAQVRLANEAFLRVHLDTIQATVQNWSPGGVIEALKQSVPELVASNEEIAEEARRPLRNKLGVELKAAVVLAALLSAERAGRLLIDGARRPSPLAVDALAAFKREDRVDLGAARISRRGPLALVEISSPQALNAEDDGVLDALEACVDIALLDERVAAGALRGAPVQNRKYAGRRVFCSGLNLTGLYEGRLSLLYYLKRELGLVSKLYRGLSFGDGRPEIEKPWIAAIDTHAIGGGCQLLLVMDYVISDPGAILSLPARTEGIIPGAANLRLSRFVGDRAARRAILMDQAIQVDSALGRLLVDEVVAPAEIDTSIERASHSFASTGTTSLPANRRALRIAQEPVELFREYMAHFSIAQAECHYSDELVSNLERHWTTRTDRSSKVI
jgi:thioesterase DpgC